ncbi:MULTISPECIES: PepSY-associated TM helix domain-containing protein [Nitrincola]|nr:PepSY-associated TM helix domain-containing protein [Nitrincola iocasae]
MSASTSVSTTLPKVNRWVRWLHIYSAAPVLLSMLFFAITGFFLNHPDLPLGETRTKQLELEIPAAIAAQDWQANKTLYSLSILGWLDESHAIRGVKIEIEWEESDDLLMIVLEGPNASQTIEVFPEEGLVDVFTLSLPVMHMLNNLHRVKSVSESWRLFSDISAILMLIFCLTGLWLLFVNKLQRVASVTWVTLGSGVFMTIIYLMH